MIVPRRNHAGTLGIGHTKNMGNGLLGMKMDRKVGKEMTRTRMGNQMD